MKLNCFVVSGLVLGVLLFSSSATFAIEQRTDFRMQEKIEKAIAGLENKEGNTQRQSKKDLIAWGSGSVEQLLAVVKDWEHRPADLRRDCVEILGEIKDKTAISVILPTLAESKMTMRYTAAKALGLIGDNRAVPYLVNALKDKEWEVRSFTADALGAIGDNSASKPLADVLSADSSDKVRLSAVTALDKVNGSAEYRTVIKAISDVSSDVRAYAAELLASWGVDEAVSAVIDMLKTDRANAARAGAARALGVYKKVETVPALALALGDGYKDVRVYSLEALKKITGQNYGSDKAAWDHWFELNKDKK